MGEKRKISKRFDLRIASDFLYSIEFSTELTETVEVENEEQMKQEAERLASQVRVMTREDASKMLQGLRGMAQQPVEATNSKKAAAVQSIQTLVTRMEALGIK